MKKPLAGALVVPALLLAACGTATSTTRTITETATPAAATVAPPTTTTTPPAPSTPAACDSAVPDWQKLLPDMSALLNATKAQEASGADPTLPSPGVIDAATTLTVDDGTYQGDLAAMQVDATPGQHARIAAAMSAADHLGTAAIDTAVADWVGARAALNRVNVQKLSIAGLCST